jgi:uncharacterized protein YaiE (UPF0345 family)
LELDFEDFPFTSGEATFGVAGESSAGISIARILEVVVTDGELCVGFLDVALIDDADVAAAENGSFFRVTGDGELSKVESVSFSKVK